MIEHTARARWSALDHKRQGLISRCERYAELTIPSICPPDNYDDQSDEMRHDLQSIGSQLTNNLINKMMLAMFAPSRPFMRIELPRQEKDALLKELQIDDSTFREASALLEMDAVRKLDEIAARPKLYDLKAHLIVTGNAVRYMDGDVMRIIGIKDFVSRRNVKGEVVELMIKETVQIDELPEEIQDIALASNKDLQATVNYFRWWQFSKGMFHETQWLDDVVVGLEKYKGKYKREDMPATHHVWRLVDKASYGIGHVEDNVGDLEGLSQLTEAEVNGAILASEFRWLVNPGGQTRVDDMKNSVNGDALPGQEGDVALVSAGPVAQTIAIVSQSADKYVRRLGAAFVLSAGVQRDAERVTAEEIRLLANELETSLGGIYSRLALDLQLPLAYWLMGKIDDQIFKGTDFKPVIVTGLDALSRNGDLENVQLFLQDVIQITNLPEPVLMFLKLDNIFSLLASGRNLKASDLVNTKSEVDATIQQQQQQQMGQQQELMATEAAVKKGM